MNKSRKSLIKGETLYKEGDIPDNAYLLVTGMLESSTIQNGTRITLGEINPGELIGEMSVLDGELRTATVEALEESSLLSINKNQLVERVVKSDPIIRSLLSGYSRRFRNSLFQGFQV